MASKKKPPNKDDPDQSRRFVEAAVALEVAGELSLDGAGKKFERAFRKAVPPRTPPKSQQ